MIIIFNPTETFLGSLRFSHSLKKERFPLNKGDVSNFSLLLGKTFGFFAQNALKFYNEGLSNFRKSRKGQFNVKKCLCP